MIARSLKLTPPKITPPRVLADGAGWRLDAEVCGEPFFVRANVPLSERGEPLIAAFALLAAYHDLRLRYLGPLDPAIFRGERAARDFAARSWGVRATPLVSLGEAAASERPALATAAFFTGDLDSFLTLVRRREELDALIHVTGFEGPRGDSAAGTAPARVREVAEASGKFLIEMETNLRDLSVFTSLPWELTRGPALAAMALALAGQVGRVYVPGRDSRAAGPDAVRGGEPDLIEGWAGPLLDLVCEDPGLDRIGKLAELSTEPLALAHLGVCEEEAPAGENCGACEACVGTMAILEALDRLPACGTLPHDGLEARIRALPSIPESRCASWRAIADLPGAAGFADVVRDKLAVVALERRTAAGPRRLDSWKWQIKNARLLGRMML
jgi:hypothetical protein